MFAIIDEYYFSLKLLFSILSCIISKKKQNLQKKIIMRQYFTQLGFWGRVLALVMLSLAFLLVSMIIGDVMAVAFFGRDAVPHAEFPVVRFLQGALSIGVFLMPAVVLCLLCRGGSPLRRLCMKPAPSLLQVILCVCIMLLSLPLSGWLEEVNLQMTFPEWMGGVEDWMRAKEDQAKRLTESLIKTSEVSSMLANIIVLAAMPAVCEEMYFRAGLQQAVIDDTTRIRKFGAALVAAFIFSAVHLQFFGFLPRFVLGAELGFMLIATGSVWGAMLAHFVNNAIAVVGGFMEARGCEFSLWEWAESPIFIAGCSVAAAVLFVVLYKCEKKL